MTSSVIRHDDVIGTKHGLLNDEKYRYIQCVYILYSDIIYNFEICNIYSR